MTTGLDDEQSRGDRDLARHAATRVLGEAQQAGDTYATLHHDLVQTGRLEGEARESAIRVIASTATTLRRLAPLLSAAGKLPEAPDLDLALLLLRLITDSLSVGLADDPECELLVASDDIADLLRIIRPTADGAELD